MVNDRQTHNLPEQSGEMDRLARFMGYSDAPAFANDFLSHVDIVRANYRTLFEHVPDPPGIEVVGPELDFRGDDPEPAATVAALNDLGYHDAKQIIAAVRRWLAGRVRALRSTRARDLMTTMVPAVLVALGRQANPDEAFNRFDRFISALPAGRAADVAFPAQSRAAGSDRRGAWRRADAVGASGAPPQRAGGSAFQPRMQSMPDACSVRG